MTRILALSGSLRKDSFNTALARAAARVGPGDAQLDVATLHGIPLYDGDLEAAEGIPPAVQALREKILTHDGLLLVTPEYNNGIPGVFKNGIDWLSRAGLREIFGGLPVGVIGASPGGWGTLLSQTAWQPTLKLLGTELYSGGGLYVSRANTLIEAGELTDANSLAALRQYLEGFARFVAKHRRG
ncbi:MAG: NADPH-dependent FMN reductase [Pseudomonadota bacterium]|nr:NADPH-dependent FMN reductase [Pseudomonadota bacterium]